MKSAHFIPTQKVTFGRSESGVAGRVLSLMPDAVGCVYGAPGTGKTSALRERFTSLVLAGGLEPEQVLVLAATRESAASLRDDLLRDLAQKTGSEFAVEGALARTVSSLAFALVRHHALANGLKAPELISGAEQDSLIAGLLEGEAGRAAEDLWPAHIGDVTRGLGGFRAELRDLISACQEHGIDSQGLRGLAGSRPEWAASASIYAAYESKLAEPAYFNRFDPATLINRAITLMEQGEGKWPYVCVLVDDAQELTPAAARLIQALVGNSTGLILFGDPDTTTLGFRQADPKLMGDLTAQVARARDACVESFALDARASEVGGVAAKVQAKLASLIPPSGFSEHRKVHLDASTGDRFDVKVFATAQDEMSWLAYSLREMHLREGIAWGEMAVVARTRPQLDALERNLAALSVPVRIAGAQTALRDEYASRELLELAAFVCLSNPLTIDAAQRLLTSAFCGLDSIGLRRLRRALRRQELEGSAENESEEWRARNSDELILELFAVEGAAATLRGNDAKKVRTFLKTISQAKAAVDGNEATVEDLLWVLWDGSKLEQTWGATARGIGPAATQANRNLDSVVALFAAANRFVERNPGGQIEDFIIAQLEQTIAEDSLSFTRKAEQFVALLTPSALVGKRFEVVALPSLIEGIWPNQKPRNSLLNANILNATVTGRLTTEGIAVRSEMSDETRMFYKALGAAKSAALVSSYFDEDEQVSQFVGYANAGTIPDEEEFRLADLTLRGMAGQLRRKLAIETDAATRARIAIDLGRLAQAGVPGAHPSDWYGLAAQSTTEPLFQFEAGAVLNEKGEPTFDPDRGEHIRLNPSQLDAFIKCPLHWFLNYHGASGSDFAASVGTLVHHAMEVAKGIDEASLWKEVESGWHSLSFESAWIEQAERRRAQKLVSNLSQYLTNVQAEGTSLVAAEQSFEFELGKAAIRGTVDRIELDVAGNVTIVDLKTGKYPPSIAEGKQNPQLGLYQLAFMNQAFTDLETKFGPEQLAGAKLVFVSGNSPSERPQDSIGSSPELRTFFEDMVASAAEGMAMPENVFVANVSSHCTASNSYGSCKIHLTKAVSYVG